MQATYATVLIVSALIGPERDYVAYVFHDQQTCSQAIALFADTWTEHDLMARCIETRIITSTSTPIPNPNR